MQNKSQFHHRQSIRLKDFPYYQSGFYFITICTHRSECIFGSIENCQVKFSDIGEIAYKQWKLIPIRFPNIILDAFVIMPNHIHGILIISNPLDENNDYLKNKLDIRPKNLGDIIGAYKSYVALECLQIFKSHNQTMGKLWQRNYYERIIRTDESYRKIVEYIDNNPVLWESDQMVPPLQ